MMPLPGTDSWPGSVQPVASCHSHCLSAPKCKRNLIYWGWKKSRIWPFPWSRPLSLKIREEGKAPVWRIVHGPLQINNAQIICIPTRNVTQAGRNTWTETLLVTRYMYGLDLCTGPTHTLQTLVFHGHKTEHLLKGRSWHIFHWMQWFSDRIWCSVLDLIFLAWRHHSFSAQNFHCVPLVNPDTHF